MGKKGEELIDIRQELREEFEDNCPSFILEIMTMNEFYSQENEKLSGNTRIFLEYDSYVRRLKHENKLFEIDKYLSSNIDVFVERSGLDQFRNENNIASEKNFTILNKKFEWDITNSFISVENSNKALINIYLYGKISFTIDYSLSSQTEFDSFLVGSADVIVKIKDKKLSNEYEINDIRFTVDKYTYRDGLMTSLHKLLSNVSDSSDYQYFLDHQEDTDN